MGHHTLVRSLLISAVKLEVESQLECLKMFNSLSHSGSSLLI